MLAIIWKVIRFLILAVPVPLAAGTLLGGRLEDMLAAETPAAKAIFRWISGQFLLWAGFQLICVPMILMGKSFSTVVLYYSVYTAVLVLGGLLAQLHARMQPVLRVVTTAPTPPDRGTVMLWVLFAGLLLLQLVCACLLAYDEGDDAFYVAVSAIAEESDTMYSKNPYSSGFVELDVRHGLAPMPIWIAYLARLSGIRTVIVAQVAEPLVLILMAYGVWFLLGQKLFGRIGKRLPTFLSVVALLILFGGYSTYSMENFLLVRTAQGKAILAGIVLPFLFLLLLALMERLSGAKPPGAGFWLLTAAVLLTACLCSTQGTVLVCLLIAVTGLCGAMTLRKWKFLIPLALSCIFPCVYAVLYVILG